MKEVGVSDADIHDGQEVWIDVYAGMLLGDIEEEAAKLFPSATEEIEKLPAHAQYGIPEPKTLADWTGSHTLKSNRLGQLLDEYDRLWTTGSMKDPSIIPFNRLARTQGSAPDKK
jgi:hypothetical protein